MAPTPQHTHSSPPTALPPGLVAIASRPRPRARPGDPPPFEPLPCAQHFTAYGRPPVLAVHEDPVSGAVTLAATAACADQPTVLAVLRAGSLAELEAMPAEGARGRWEAVRASAGDLRVDPG